MTLLARHSWLRPRITCWWACLQFCISVVSSRWSGLCLGRVGKLSCMRCLCIIHSYCPFLFSLALSLSLVRSLVHYFRLCVCARVCLFFCLSLPLSSSRSLSLSLPLPLSLPLSLSHALICNFEVCSSNKLQPRLGESTGESPHIRMATPMSISGLFLPASTAVRRSLKIG